MLAGSEPSGCVRVSGGLLRYNGYPPVYRRLLYSSVRTVPMKMGSFSSQSIII